MGIPLPHSFTRLQDSLSSHKTKTKDLEYMSIFSIYIIYLFIFMYLFIYIYIYIYMYMLIKTYDTQYVTIYDTLKLNFDTRCILRFNNLGLELGVEGSVGWQWA